jgi:thiol-disulfide isomerase/thioredoxin
LPTEFKKTTLMPLRSVLATLVLLLTLPAPASAGELASIFDPVAGSPPTELVGKTLDGTVWRLDDHRGQVVLASFWAGWCAPCINEMPTLIRLAKRLHGRPFALVGINTGEPELRVRTLAQQLGIGFPVLQDPQGAELARWGVQILPTAYLLDGQGRRRLVAQGPVDWDDPEALRAIEGLMGEMP